MPQNPDALDSLQPVFAGAPLQCVVPVGPQEIRALEVAGRQFFEQGQWDKARNVFSALTSLAPSSPLGHAGLGVLALKQARYKDALQSLTQAVQLQSADLAVYTNLGEVILRMGNATQAKVVLKCAVDLDPSKRDPAGNRARALLEAIAETASAESAASS